jgi:hypothetical protein
MSDFFCDPLEDNKLYRVIHVKWRAWPDKNATQNTIYKAISIPITLS